MSLSLDDVARLAPDEKSVHSARQLLSLGYWSELGLSTDSVWGRCQGNRLYNVGVDLSSLTGDCNCPSRKVPCRHVLGLLMLLASVPDALPVGDLPEWWRERLTRLRKKQQSAGRTTQPATDLEAQKRRSDRRHARILEGLDRLSLWLADLIRHGLAELESRDFSFWDEPARRLVDAQAPGLARRVRALAEIPNSGPNWPRHLFDELGRIQLLIAAARRLDELPEHLQADIRQLLGQSLRQPELEAQGSRLEDDWICLGIQEEDDDRFRTRRTWLWGTDSQRPALILDFAAGRDRLPQAMQPGTKERAELLFYPGSLPLRARLMQRDEAASPGTQCPSGIASLSSMLDDFADRLAAQPFLTNWPCFVSQVTLAQQHDKWFLCDADGQGVPLRHPRIWNLLALTGGNPATLFGEWNGRVFFPIGAFVGDRYQAL